MGKKDELNEALQTQFNDVSQGGDGQKKKESVESLKILYDLSMAQDKADLDSEFRESEMQLKEREMALKEAEQKAKHEKEKKELELREEELRIKDEEIKVKKLEAETKSCQAENDALLKQQEIDVKKAELAIKKADTLNRKIEVGLGVGSLISGFIGQRLYQKNFNKVYDIETKTVFVPAAQRALRYAQNLERLAIEGVKIFVKKR